MGVKKKRINPDAKLLHLDGATGEVQTEMEGGERIFSREDTAALVAASKGKDTPEQLAALGKQVYQMIVTQRNTPPEYAKE
jgi:hypothetical protein